MEVEFSCHCFTRSLKEDEAVDPSRFYPGENRVFDCRRYEMSTSLLDIVSDLPKRGCFHTGHGNFFVLEHREDDETYEIYFRVEKVGKGRLKLFVQSAYIRDSQHGTGPQSNKIGFFVILFNTLTEKPIKCQKRK